MKYTALSVLILTLFTWQPLQAQQASEEWQFTENEAPTLRHENAAARAGDKLYLLGGRGERPVDIYNPQTGRWTTGATPPLPMHHFQAVAMDDKIYVIGALTGNYPDEDPVPNVYIYETEADRWVKGPAIPRERRRGAAAAVAYENKIYIAGGIQNGHIDGHVRYFDSFDPATGQWEQLAEIPRYRDHFQAAIIDGKLYAAGGRRTSQASGRVFELTIPEVDVYDFSSGSWSPLQPVGDLPTERAGTTSIAVGDNLIVIGGESGSQQPAHAEAEAYNTRTGEWSALPKLQTGRHGTQAVILGDAIYIGAGSKVRGADEIKTVEVLPIPQSLRN